MAWLVVLGTTPELSVLELQSLGYAPQWQGGEIASVVTNRPALDRLGGTIKIADSIQTLPRSLVGHNTIADWLLRSVPEDKRWVFGFSVYAGDTTVTKAMINDYAKTLQRLALGWKKQWRATGRSVRYVSSREPALSSVIVHKEHLLDHQTDIIMAIYKDHIVVARTTQVQDYAGFSQRDYGRPERDHHSGMLPPKVARMMINIACGVNSKDAPTILDPFCGSGTIIQEALQLGFKNVIGSDISQKCVADTKTNIAWLRNQVEALQATPLPELLKSDILHLHQHIPAHSIDLIVTEGYLGPVQPKQIEKINQELTALYREVFPVLAKLLKPDGRLIIALPNWKSGNGLLEMPLNTTITQAGFKVFHQPIIYGRPNAQVLRQILFLVANRD